MKKKIQKGFSLVELMIVVAIIAILAAVAIPLYSNYTIRAKIGSEISKVGGLKAEIGEAINNNNALSVSSGYSKDANVAYNASGAIGISVNADGTAATTSNSGPDYIQLTPSFNSGSITWACIASGPDINASKIPTNCTYNGSGSQAQLSGTVY